MARRFSQIDGSHPFRPAVPGGYINYRAKRRRGGKVFYFNFNLAAEMGLISPRMRHELTSALADAILDTFSLVIINEYDIINRVPVRPSQILPHRFMATRYLQLQHPDRRGLTSGDGRSIWNGCYRAPNGVTWDISSNGTGATRLSPATALENRFFKTGHRRVSYGCGQADLLDGVSSAVMSEIFHQNGIPTERVLAVIAFPDNTAINVRAYPNLLRPAHFFCHLKQGNYEALKGVVDYYIDRQVENGEWPRLSKKRRYRQMLSQIAQAFGRCAARFENEYIFCWMDWDGDNILVDGAIIDYGSVRQFGLYHHEYRYDDVNQYSTSLREQKTKARYIVQNFAQIADFLQTGRKRNLRCYASDPALRIFEQAYQSERDYSVLFKMGLPEAGVKALLKSRHLRPVIRRFGNLYHAFERVQSAKGLYEVSDGVMRDAIFSLRDLMRELPKFYYRDSKMLEVESFLQLMKSSYAMRRDLDVSPHRKQQVLQFQRLYRTLVKKAARKLRCKTPKLLAEMSRRSEIINRYDRVTGDAVLFISQKLVRNRRRLSSRDIHHVIDHFVKSQLLVPHKLPSKSALLRFRNKNVQRIFRTMLQTVKECREGI